MHKILLGLFLCMLVPVFGRADSVKVDESGPEGTLPIVTFSAGSTYLLGSSVTPCSGVLSGVPECWNIDIIVADSGSTFGSPNGRELSEPETGKVSDSFGGVSAHSVTVTVNGVGIAATDIQFRLF